MINYVHIDVSFFFCGSKRLADTNNYFLMNPYLNHSLYINPFHREREFLKDYTSAWKYLVKKYD